MLCPQCALLFTAVVTFVEVAFVEPPGYVDALFIVNRCIDGIFIVDMFLQFFLMYPQQPKSVQDTVRWIHDQDRIAMNYVKSWFGIDLISILVSGFDFLSLTGPQSTGCGRIPETNAADTAAAADAASQLKVLRIIRILRLVKLVRLVRSSRIMKRLESRMAINYGHLALVKCLVGLIICSHWFACLWGLIATFESDKFDNSWYAVFGYCSFNPIDGGALEKSFQADPSNSTLKAAYDKQYSSEPNWCCEGTGTPTKKCARPMPARPNATRAPPPRLPLLSPPSPPAFPSSPSAVSPRVLFPPPATLSRSPSVSPRAPGRYVVALYWAIMTITSIGYGDIRAPDGNTHEQVFAAILMLLGGMIWGMVIATFCGVVSNLDPAGTEFRTTMDNLNRFMALQGLPQDMRQSLREYFHQTKHLQIARANKLLIENMSPMLQGMVVWKVNEKWLRHVWFLAQAEDSFMVQLSLHLTAAVFAPAELCPQGYMYIIHRGIALYGGKVLTSGKVWGEDMILSSVHLRSKYAARCMTYVEVYMIGRDDLIELATKHPATLRLIRRSAFRLGFRREMIRRAQVSIKNKEEAAGIHSKESVADKMLVSVSSRKLDEEQVKEELQKRAEMDAEMANAGDGAPVALPPLPEVSGDSGEVLQAVQSFMQAAAKQQAAAHNDLEQKLQKQGDEMRALLKAFGEKLDKPS